LFAKVFIKKAPSEIALKTLQSVFFNKLNFPNLRLCLLFFVNFTSTGLLNIRTPDPMKGKQLVTRIAS